MKKQFYFFILLVVCSALHLHAAIETSENSITGGSVSTGSSVTAVDNKYSFMQSNPTTWRDTFGIARAVGRVRVGFDHTSLNYVSTAQDYIFHLKIQYKDSSLSGTSTIYRQLEAKYDPSAAASYQDAALYEVNTVGVVWIKVTVDSIYDNIGTAYVSSISGNNMYVQAGTEVERYYVLDYTSAPAAGVLGRLAPATSGYTDSNEVQVHWYMIRGAEQYQLEWTYINDYNISGGNQSTDSLVYDFTHNSTRITTSQHTYNIPVLFDRGFLLFRLRAMTKAYDATSGEWKWVAGKWTTDISGAGSSNTVTHFLVSLSTHSYYILYPHETLKNWQYVGTFAEEGKKKEVVSYYDGTLHNRQTVTKTSTDKKVLVGETFYDFQGRAAVTSLPAPVPNITDAMIKYYNGFNLVDSSAVTKGYSRYDFDVDASVCSTPALGMKTTTGASNYYSSSNPDQSNQQAFLPDAQKFPFTQVEYMPDNTGRIRQQSGVGPDHTLASGHQTQYFYGQPFQEELDRLFGSDAGYKKHYNKTVTIDANGQASVTYLDQEGRTVATALAGKNPYNLAPLTGTSGDTLYKTNTTAFTVDLLSKDTVGDADNDHDDNILSADGRTLSVNTQFVVPFAQQYSFSYSLTGAQYSPSCLPSGICYQCVYDMSIRIRNQCGETLADTTTKVGTFNTSCSAGNATFSISPPDLDVTLAAGSYTVTKTLSIDNDTLEKYWQDYLTRSTCVRTLQSFIDSAELHVDTSGCHISSTDETGYISPCEASYLMMLSDVSPNGQYAQYLVSRSPAPSQYPVSVLNDGVNYLPHSNSNWRHPLRADTASHYYDTGDTVISRIPLYPIDTASYDFVPAVYNSSTAHSNLVHADGVWTIEPQYLADVADFVFNWKSSWATSLVEYHPEYCYYKWCKGDMVGQGTGADTLSSDEYDSLLLSTDTYADASAAGLLDPLGNANATANQSNCNDPYFRAHGLGYHQFSQAAANAINYSTAFQGSGISIWELARIITTCGTVYGSSTDVDNCLTAQSGLSPLPTDLRQYINCGTTSLSDSTWRVFKSLYLSLKQHFQHTQQDSSARACGGYNGCIGNTQYDAYASGMIGSPTNINSWPFFTDPSPCGSYYQLYQGKIQRFPSEQSLVQNIGTAWSGDPATVVDSLHNQGDYDFYEQTGQCPGAFALQSLFNAINSEGQLKGTSVALQHYPAFSPAMYDALTGHPTNFNAVSWSGSGSGSTLTVSFGGASPLSCSTNVTLIFPAGSSLSWSGLGGTFTILNFSQLTSTGSGNFSVVATVDDDNNSSTPPITQVLTGSSGCFDVSCSFPSKCQPNGIALEFYNLLNMLAANGDLYNTGGTSITLTSGSYGSFFNATQMHSILGSGTFYWTETGSGTNEFKIWNGSSGYPEYYIRIPSLPTSGVTSFNSLVINDPDTTATVNANDGSNHSVSFSFEWVHNSGGAVHVDELPLGSCGQIAPTVCTGDDFQRRADLEALLNKLATDGKLASGSSTDLYTYPKFTPLLAATFGPTSYHYDNDTSGNVLTAAIVNDTTSDTVCNVTLTFNSTPSGSNSWGSVMRIKNLVADEANMVNGVAYSFTAVAWFSDSTSMAITGTSCWGIRNCSVCMADDGNTYENFDSFNSGSPGFTTTLTYTASCPGTGYYTVTQSASTLCSDTTLTGQDHTQPGTGSYYFTKFSSNGAQTLWSKSTTVTALTAYTFSCWYMNNWLDSAQDNVTLELWVDGSKVASTLISDTTAGTWHKLYGTWSGSYTGGSITIEIKTSGAGAVDTKLGIDDIGFYTNGCAPLALITPADTSPTYPYCDSCRQNALYISIANGHSAYQQYIDSVEQDFKAKYIAHCMGSAVELFDVTDTLREYHYTLYYYDQGGNLVRTVPPAGVVPVDLGTYGQTIKSDRKARTDNPSAAKTFFTAHTLFTTYTYNTLNQLVEQVTPDGDTTRFWYDKLGRIVASQNARQKPLSPQRYSYTKYDAQGRIVEVGELATSRDLKTATFAQQQRWLNDYTFPDSLDNGAVSSSNYRYQVTRTYYDAIKFSTPAGRFSDGTQDNLRKRVASAAIYKLYDGSDGSYNAATHYSYDIHGNVQELLQENTDLTDLNDNTNHIYQTTKDIQYKYDLVSGKVNELWYQKGFADQYFYKYEYDADNRVTGAYSSTDYRQWDRDSKYFYYTHGPLARTEIGQDKVQGCDYAYTLHGWIKGVNSNKLATLYDMGKDADGTLTVNLNQYVCADQFGYSLTYYDTTGHEDYASIAASSWLADLSGSKLQTAAKNLWNGNIKDMITSIGEFMGGSRPQGRLFVYDQLNRIKGASADTNYIAGSNTWGTNGNTTKWKENFTYDENGNITKLVRHGNVLTPMDSLNYYYNSASNQLNYVTDAVSSGNYGDDIDNESSNNYLYDGTGNLIHDVSQEIDTIKWTVYGKISDVIRTTSSSKADLHFDYDAMGNRICKIVKPRNGSGVESQDNWTYVYYERDAQGNVLTTYSRAFGRVSGGHSTETFSNKENDLYGSARVGIRSNSAQLSSVVLTVSGTNSDGSFNVTAVAAASGTAVATNEFDHKVGEKNYEMTNHLGNVLVTVSDMRTASNGGSGTTIVSFGAVVNSATDYYAFGSPMEGRSYQAGNYAVGFNGKRKDDETYGSGDEYDYGMRIYDCRLGRFLSTDPLTRSYPFYSPYQFAGNSTIWCIDVDGLEPIPYNGKNLPQGATEGQSMDIGPASIYYHNGNGVTQSGWYTATDYQIVVGKYSEIQSSTIREYEFALQYPVQVGLIGQKAEYGAFNINSAAAYFAINAKLPNPHPEFKGEGTIGNAFRHAVWQGILTNDFGWNVADQAGNAHEDNPYLYLQKPYSANLSFVNKMEGDEWVDEMNNNIARTAVSKAKANGSTFTQKDIAKMMLGTFHSDGLWILQRDGNGYKPVLYKLTDNEYKDALKNLDTCDNAGYNSVDYDYFKKQKQQQQQKK